MTDEELLTQKMESASQCLDNDIIFSEKPNHTTACSIFAQYVDYLRKKADAAVPEYMLKFYEYLTKAIFDRPSYTWIGPFANVIRENNAKCKQHVPATAHAIDAVPAQNVIPWRRWISGFSILRSAIALPTVPSSRAS